MRKNVGGYSMKYLLNRIKNCRRKNASSVHYEENMAAEMGSVPSPAELSRAASAHGIGDIERGIKAQLIKCPPSHGELRLDTLELLIHEGKPSVLWCVSWRGAYLHADGAGGYVPIPEEILPDLNADSLVRWMLSSSLSQNIGDLVDLSIYANDEKAIKWCKEIRRWWRQAQPDK